MPQSEIIEVAYRLQAADLREGPHDFTISRVSLEGFEASQPVAHFRETRKRLLLSPDHCRTLILLTGSALFADWTGVAVRITADAEGGYASIRVLPVPERGRFLRRLRLHLVRNLPARGPDTARQFAVIKRILSIGLLAVVSYLLARTWGAQLVDIVLAWRV